MAARFTPLQFALIEEGRLAAAIDDEVQEAAAKLLAHVKKYGPEATVKAKAEVTLKVTIMFDGADESDYSIKGAISSKIPGRPCHVTKAMSGQEQTGEEVLFVRASGSDASSPRQGKLATDDGRAIDLGTGKPTAPAPTDRERGGKKAGAVPPTPPAAEAAASSDDE